MLVQRPMESQTVTTADSSEGMIMAINDDKLMDFLHKFVGDLGATMAAGNVVIGHRLGLYKALAAGSGHRGRAGHATETCRATWTSGCGARRPAGTCSSTPTAAPTR